MYYSSFETKTLMHKYFVILATKKTMSIYKEIDFHVNMYIDHFPQAKINWRIVPIVHYTNDGYTDNICMYILNYLAYAVQLILLSKN